MAQEQLVRVTALQADITTLQAKNLELLENRVKQGFQPAAGEGDMHPDILREKLSIETRAWPRPRGARGG